MRLLTALLISSMASSSSSSLDHHSLRQKFDLIRHDCGEVCDTTIAPTSGYDQFRS